MAPFFGAESKSSNLVGVTLGRIGGVVRGQKIKLVEASSHHWSK